MFSLYTVISIVISSFTWQTFRSIEGGFEVDVPGKLEHNIQQINTDLGTIDFHTYYLSTQNNKQGNFFFQVSYYQSEALVIPADSSELLSDFFAATVQQAAISVAGEVLILDEIRYQGKYPGRFWRIHYNGGRSVLRTKAYLVDDKFYSVQVAVDSDFSLDEDIDHFINSFKLIDSIN